MDISLLSGSMEVELDEVALYILMFLIDCFTRIHPFLFLRLMRQPKIITSLFFSLVQGFCLDR